MTSTIGCSVVPDSSCNQLVSCFQPVIKWASVILKSSRILNIFSTPVKQTNSLQPDHDCGVLTHSVEVLDCFRLRDATVVTPPPFSMSDYIEAYPNFFDMPRSRCVWDDCNELLVHGHLENCGNTAVTGCMKCWIHCGGVGPLTFAMLAKRRICRSCSVVKRGIINAAWSECLHGGVSRLEVLKISLIWIILFSHHSLTACGVSSVTNSGPAIVNLKCGCVLMVYCPGHFLGGITLNCLHSFLVSDQRCMCQSLSCLLVANRINYSWRRRRPSLHTKSVWCYAVLRLKRGFCGGLKLQNSWCLC